MTDPLDKTDVGSVLPLTGRVAVNLLGAFQPAWRQFFTFFVTGSHPLSRQFSPWSRTAEEAGRPLRKLRSVIWTFAVRRSLLFRPQTQMACPDLQVRGRG